jgi:hypothetical protein
MLRGAVYAAAFLAIMVRLGLTTAVHAVGAFPATMAVGFVFGALGLLVATFVRSWQDFDYVLVVQFALFLFSGTFAPVESLHPVVRGLVELSPLYHGVALVRGLTTGVVDSTLLSERLGDQAMAGVWTAHDRVARDLLPLWRGREIDKTDGMLLLFDNAADAVHYALAYHQALAAMPVPLKARAGLHVGPVMLRENSPEDVARGAKPLEVEGLAKPATARIMAIGPIATT